MNPSTSSADDDYEEVTVVVEVNGIIDANAIRKAVKEGEVNLRFAGTAEPVLQVKNSLFSGKWTTSIASNVVLKGDGDDNLELVGVSTRTLSCDKVNLAQVDKDKKSKKKNDGNDSDDGHHVAVVENMLSRSRQLM